VTAFDFAGLVSAVTGLAMALLGLALALLGGLGVLLVPRGRRRLRRGIARGGAVLVLCGLVLFLAADLAPAPALRRTFDRGIIAFSGAALLLAVAAGVRAARRRAQSAPEPLAAAAGQGALERPGPGATTVGSDSPPVAPE